MTVTQFLRHRKPPTQAPPETLAQQVYDRAQNQASEMRRFRRDWPFFPQLAQFELVVSDDLLAALNRLSAELERNHFASAHRFSNGSPSCPSCRRTFHALNLLRR